MKNKILYIFALMIFTLILFAGNVNAAEYKSSDNGLIITMNDLGVGGIKSAKSNWTYNEDKYEEYDYDYIYNTITIKNVKQDVLNEYAKSPKKIKVNIKLKLPNDTSKVVFYKRNYSETESKYIETDLNKEHKIETINGNKYLVYDSELHYNNISEQEPIDNNILSIAIYDSEFIYESDTYIKIYKSNGSFQKYSLDTQIDVISENKPFNYSFEYVNKYGQKYPTVGGAGGPLVEDKWYLTAKWNIEGPYGFYERFELPASTKLSEVYLALYIDVYQGDKIQVEGMGSLYYSGIAKKDDTIVYVYKNSLDKLNKITKPVSFKARTDSGYTLTRGIYYGWHLNELAIEEQIKVENTDITLNMLRYDGDLKLGRTKAKKTDILYEETKNKDEIYGSYNAYINVNNLSILSGSYQGNINIIFDVGAQHNGEKYKLFYYNEGTEGSFYIGTVKDGKVIITVNTSDIKRVKDDNIKEGDINGDGKINTKDAREVLLGYIGKKTLTTEQKRIVDVNKDGKINTKDARQILLYYIGKIKEF